MKMKENFIRHFIYLYVVKPFEALVLCLANLFGYHLPYSYVRKIRSRNQIYKEYLKTHEIDPDFKLSPLIIFLYAVF